jgi:hypothetical protein
MTIPKESGTTDDRKLELGSSSLEEKRSEEEEEDEVPR